MDTEHRALQIVRDHLAQPPATGGFVALRRAVGQEGSSADVVRDLANRVGGLDALEHLDDAPIADEPFDWSVVPDAHQAFVRDVLVTIDETCDRWLDVEYRTIARRLLARVLLHDSTPLRRSQSPDRVAAGVVHAVLAGNGELGRRTGRFRAADVAAWCGVSSAGDVAQTLVAAASFERAFDDGDRSWHYDSRREVSLASAVFLHSRKRRVLLAERASAITACEAHEARRARRRPLVDMGDGHVTVRSCPVDVAVVRKGRSSAGQTMILVGVAPLVPDPELEMLALSVPEARRLAGLLDHELNRSPMVCELPHGAHTPPWCDNWLDDDVR